MFQLSTHPRNRENCSCPKGLQWVASLGFPLSSPSLSHLARHVRGLLPCGAGAPQQLFNVLGPASVGQGISIVPTLGPGGTDPWRRHGNTLLFARWLSTVFMTLEQLGEPHPCQAAGNPSWAWINPSSHVSPPQPPRTSPAVPSANRAAPSDTNQPSQSSSNVHPSSSCSSDPEAAGMADFVRYALQHARSQLDGGADPPEPSSEVLKSVDLDGPMLHGLPWREPASNALPAGPQEEAPMQQDAADKQPGLDQAPLHDNQTQDRQSLAESSSAGTKAHDADRFVVMRDAELLRTSSSIAVWQQQLELVRITLTDQAS
ncbi:hypothetical protein WJX84_000800 [Apatococcus fuscideae]|uniref:Uncharacterized protein n=1 Tax=Apatococcus fuscideae TaxID=2026836 RepID=A0AAW1SRB2_9CHLO